MTTIHTLRTFAEYWDAVFAGDKTFEVRKDDRGFNVGDYLELIRTSDDGQVMPLRVAHGQITSILVKVTYILPLPTLESGDIAGVAPDHVIMGLKRL